MTADKLKALSFTELQRAYTAYLEKQGLSPGTINASKSGAFYLLKNAPSVDFWSLLFSKNKVAALNGFYSTNIFSLYPVARHILALHIDERLYAGDLTLVNEIKQIELKGKARQLYSFASKYCSHHNPTCYPIYDSYIHQILVYFRRQDRFAQFHTNDLKNYLRFHEILLSFRHFYGLDLFTLKQLDQYLWQLGKQYFSKHYNSAAAEH